jgi:hypothetical protein
MRQILFMLLFGVTLFAAVKAQLPEVECEYIQD